jgi:hypothetical protein
MTAPARKSRPEQMAVSNGRPPVEITEETKIVTDAGLTRKALTLLVGELKAAIRDHACELALLRAQVAALREAAPVPDGYVALKRAAGATGYSDEWLRQRCKRGAIDCVQVGGRGGKWYVAVGTLAQLQLESGATV